MDKDQEQFDADVVAAGHRIAEASMGSIPVASGNAMKWLAGEGKPFSEGSHVRPITHRTMAAAQTPRDFNVVSTALTNMAKSGEAAKLNQEKIARESQGKPRKRIVIESNK